MKWKKGFWITKMFPFDCVIKNLIELFIGGFYGKMYGLVNDEKPDYHRHGLDNVNKKECISLEHSAQSYGFTHAKKLARHLKQIKSQR